MGMGSTNGTFSGRTAKTVLGGSGWTIALTSTLVLWAGGSGTTSAGVFWSPLSMVSATMVPTTAVEAK